MDNNRTKFLNRRLKKIDPTIAKIFMPWILKNPKNLYTIMRLARAYRKTRRKRGEEMLENLKVPPFLILSITSQCNLTCTGCYAAATRTLCDNKGSNSLNLEQWINIIEEASELGVFGFIIAGGEPFLMANLLEISELFKDRLFLIVTNGTTLGEQEYKRLKHLKNTVIIVSIEGDQELTNLRRGSGVYEKVLSTINKLDEIGVICGISVTINRNNFKFWTESKNIDDLISKGVRLAFLLEYIPTDNDIEFMLTEIDCDLD